MEMNQIVLDGYIFVSISIALTDGILSIKSIRKNKTTGRYLGLACAGTQFDPFIVSEFLRMLIFDKVSMTLKATDAGAGISMCGVIAESETNFNQLYGKGG